MHHPNFLAIQSLRMCLTLFPLPFRIVQLFIAILYSKEEHHIICSDIRNSHGNLPACLRCLWDGSRPTADTSNRIPVPGGQWVLKRELLESDQSASLQHKETFLKKMLGPVFIDKHDVNVKLNLSFAFRLKTIALVKN